MGSLYQTANLALAKALGYMVVKDMRPVQVVENEGMAFLLQVANAR